MTANQVEAIMGRPAHIEASETADQNLSGEVDHYPTSQGDDQVVFVNHSVFKTQLIAGPPNHERENRLHGLPPSRIISPAILIRCWFSS